MKKTILFAGFLFIGTFAFANNKIQNDEIELTTQNLILDSLNKTFKISTKSVCETAADAAYNTAIAEGSSPASATNIYNATLKACEAKLKEIGFD